MTGYIEPPPPQRRRMGCLGKGCLLLSLLLLFLFIAGAVGIYYGLRTHSAVARGMLWAQQTGMLTAEPSPLPEFQTTEENIRASTRKWRDFDRASQENGPAYVELTAADLNNLIAKNSHARGRAFVSIENNRLHVQTSVPLAKLTRRERYYLSGDIVIQTDGPRSLDHLPLDSITINGRPLPRDLLGWTFDSRPLSDYVAEYRGDVNANTFEIRDGKLILDKQGR
jgi:hypothetical protein